VSQVIFILLFGLPFIVFPWGISPFETPKVFVAEMILALLLIQQILFQPKFIRVSRDWLYPIGLIFGLSLLHVVFLHTPTTIFGNVFRLQGVFLLWLLLGWVLTIANSNLLNIKSQWVWIAFSGLLISVFLFGWEENGRWIGSLGEPNALAATAIFFWPWLSLAEIKVKNNLSTFLPPTFTFIIILFSGSRSGIVAFILQLLFLLFFKFTKSFKKSFSWIIILLIFGLTLPFWETKIFENRVEIWQTALSAGWKNPILGHGFGNIEQALKQTAINLSNNLRFQYVDSSHNFLLDWWVQGGMVGLGALIYLLNRTVRNFIKKQARLELVLLIGVVTVMLFNPVSVVTLVHFWWLIGWGAVQTDLKVV